MDDILTDLVVAKFRQDCSRPFSSVLSVTKDPDRQDVLIYETRFGSLRGRVSEEDGNLVFRFGKREVVIPATVFLGKPH